MTDILERIDDFLSEAEYKPRKVHHGRKRSQASKMKGAEKTKYLKMLKDRRRKYKTNKAAKRKAKKTATRYKRTSGAKIVKRMYKGKK